MTVTLPAPVAAGPELSGPRVDRVCGLPVEAVGFGLAETGLLLDGIAECDAFLAEVADQVSDTLYRLVPLLDHDPGLRRTVLKVRRATRSDKPVGVGEAELERIAGALPSDEAGLFRRWSATALARARLLDRLPGVYERETAAAGSRLRDLLAEPALSTGIAHASADLLKHVDVEAFHPGSKTSRSVLSYAVRAARKTSPFSTFTGIGMDGRRSGGRSNTALSQTHVFAWLQALVRDERLVTAFDLEPIEAVRTIDGEPRALVSAYRIGDAFAWRTDEMIDISVYRKVMQSLAGIGRAGAAEYMIRLGGADPFAALQRLLDAGMLRVVAPWVRGDPAPLLAVADNVRRVGTEYAAAMADTLRRLHADALALADHDGPRRVRTLEAMADRAQTELKRLGVAEDRTGFAVYDDAETIVDVPSLGDHVEADLRELAERMRPMIFRSHMYDMLVDIFVERYGAGGRCPDALRFCMEVSNTPDLTRRLYAAIRADAQTRGRATERAWLPVGPSSAPPTVAVAYQLAAESEQALHRGGHRLVVNQLNPGSGGLVARFRTVLDGPDGLADRLRAWTSGNFPEAQPRELVISADVNGLQYACCGAIPALTWPSELPLADGGDTLAVSELSVVHDAAAGTLTLLDPHGRPVAPVYLGVVPQHLVLGPARYLMVIGDPWVQGSGLSCARSPSDRITEPAGEVETTARQGFGRVVTKRATWRIRPADFPRPERGEPAAGYFHRADRWRRRLGIPEEVFLSLETPGISMEHGKRKPVLLDFRSPHSLHAAAGLAVDGVVAMSLAESLPGRHGYWLPGPDGRHAVEHVSYLRWERPRSDGGRTDARHA
ncbi:lantibiotic dehydratase [Planomonospora sp. ID67723]|uniref:lantibiotic dehydratase n=1 Tax=Planomonospora sp. ID67723 TaxID=2738134 RepID=UPI0018C3DAF7|nr:lantibiotic dehydratase [Planomonospora sp. ID67723]MBG0827798.1 lantibiotic dehydratase [Planomonospora sp. ID67723]